MSIYAYTGLPGSGKSHDVVKNQILPALKAGRTVVTNVPLHEDALREVAPDGQLLEFPTERVAAAPELIAEYAKPGCVLVLDEVWRLWPAGWKADKVPTPFKSLLAEHRHMVDERGDSMQIVLVTQDLAQISAFARQLVETTFHHTKLTTVGADGSYRIDVYNGAVTGANPPASARVRQLFGKYDPAVFKLYKSHTMSKASKAGANEKGVDGRANVLRSPLLWGGALAVVVAVAWGLPAAKGAIARDAAPALGAGVGPSVPGTSRVVDRPAAGEVVRAWRVVGTITTAARGGSWALLSDGVSSVRLPLDAFCERTLEGWTVCQWEGQEATDIVRPLRLRSERSSTPEGS